MVEASLPNRVRRRISARVGRVQRWLLNGLAKPHPQPIFILGNQKTGTTAIAHLMARASGLSLASDLRGLYQPTQTQLHSGELSLRDFISRNRVDFSREIIKEPGLTFLAKQLSDCFPGARYVFVQRDPRSNIRSILNRLSLPGHLDQLPDADFNRLTAEWKLVLDGKWLGLDGRNYIEMLAQRWSLAAQIRQQLSEVVVIRYEGFCADKAGSIRSLLNDMDLEWRNDIASIVNTQFQPRGNRQVAWDKFFGANLGLIESQCADQMRPFGYEPSVTPANTGTCIRQ
jgi:hypothetical protein